MPKKPKPEIDWSAELAQARRGLRRNAAAIDSTPRGTAGASKSDWRLGGRRREGKIS